MGLRSATLLLHYERDNTERQSFEPCLAAGRISTPNVMTTPPIACTLASEDYANRLAWIGRLNRESLRSHRLDGVSLELVYDRTAIDQVRELVKREESCCSFLRFSMNETGHAIHLRIEAPAEACDSTGTVTSAVFAPFLAGS